MQQRQVIAIVSRTSPQWSKTPATCGPNAATLTHCIAATLDQDRIVLVTSGPYHDKYILGPVLIDGRDVAQAIAVRTSTFSGTRGWQVEYRLTPEGAKRFATATTNAVHAQPPGNQIAIIVDGRVISAPIVQAPIRNGNGVITGNYDEQRAKALAVQLEGTA
jgi:preprotein translocase subunit SecD